jgi:Stress responsive A/B Barrel Domain
MILHIVCLRFKPGTRTEAIAATGQALLGMAGRIPEIRQIRWNPNLAPTAADYSHVLTVAVDDLAALERYLVHPAHQDVSARHIAPIRDARLALDIEV